MNWFIDHKIIKDIDGYTIVLYLDQQLSEFASEFNTIPKEDKENLEKDIRTYIKKKLPNIKVKTVNIMLGSLLVASLHLSDVHAASAVAKSQYQKVETYIVKSGDTLYKIATTFGTTVPQLKSTNGLTSDMIYIGQSLRIPNDKKNIYIVKSGDALYKIASQYNVTVQQLKVINKLTSDMIYVGQTLHIPNQELVVIVNSLPNGVFKLSSRGDSVKRIQKALNTLGYSIVENGTYGSTTKTSILDFQKQYAALSNDGIYGSQTKKYLQHALLTDHIIVSNPSDVLVLVNKNYSLPSNYVPQSLVVPKVPFPFNEYSQKKLMRQDAAVALEALFRKAKADNIDLYATSGYRSYSRQKEIFTSKVMSIGMEKANQFSAKPGESEHQTGLAMDVTSPSVNLGLSQSFGETKEGIWLKNNAAEFGFIIRYQRGKEYITGYQYEPWHIRYVGKSVAKTIASKNITFEDYLGKR